MKDKYLITSYLTQSQGYATLALAMSDKKYPANVEYVSHWPVRAEWSTRTNNNGDWLDWNFINLRADWHSMWDFEETIPNLRIISKILSDSNRPDNLIKELKRMLRFQEVLHDPRTGLFVPAFEIVAPNMQRYMAIGMDESGEQPHTYTVAEVLATDEVTARDAIARSLTGRGSDALQDLMNWGANKLELVQQNYQRSFPEFWNLSFEAKMVYLQSQTRPAEQVAEPIQEEPQAQEQPAPNA